MGQLEGVHKSVNQLSLILFLERFWKLGVSGLGRGTKYEDPLPLVESWSLATIPSSESFFGCFCGKLLWSLDAVRASWEICLGSG